MEQERELTGEPSVLTPRIPRDIGIRSQRQRILDAMAESCAEKTFAATTIGDLVGLASISRATFYRHFGNKRECFDAAVAEFVDDLETAAIAAQSAADSRSAAISQAIGAILETMARKPEYASLVLIDAPIVEPTILERHRERAVKGLEAQWRAGKGGKRSGADSRIAFGRAHVLIADQLAAGRAAQLPEVLPELVYVALLPFVGHEAALAQDKLAR
jgi:AcrR family transcriptional regulator